MEVKHCQRTGEKMEEDDEEYKEAVNEDEAVNDIVHCLCEEL